MPYEEGGSGEATSRQRLIAASYEVREFRARSENWSATRRMSSDVRKRSPGDLASCLRIKAARFRSSIAPARAPRVALAEARSLAMLLSMFLKGRTLAFHGPDVP